MNTILGVILTLYTIADGTRVQIQEMPAKEYLTVEECLKDAYEINRDAATNYVLYCVPKLGPSDMIDTSKDKGTPS